MPKSRRLSQAVSTALIPRRLTSIHQCYPRTPPAPTVRQLTGVKQHDVSATLVVCDKAPAAGQLFVRLLAGGDAPLPIAYISSPVADVFDIDTLLQGRRSSDRA